MTIYKEKVLKICTLFIVTILAVLNSGCSHKAEHTYEYFTVYTPIRPQPKVKISAYDPIMRKHASENGYDWRFLSAICYHESRFLENAVSPTGAVGIMQVLPSIARNLGHSAESLKDPNTNIQLAIKILKGSEKSMRIPSQMNREDRLRIVLACYNGGVGHVSDALRLAVKHGEGYNWAGIQKYMILKNDPQYYTDSVVRCGHFNSNETIKFVNAVMNKYNHYLRLHPGA